MKMTDCSLEAPISDLEAKAREKFYFLDTINEFSRLINLGMYPGKERKSVQKLNDYLEKLWHSTLAEVEANEWYQSEKKAMEKMNMDEIMADGSGEYDPNYKVKMPDVFRKQA